MRNKKNLLLIFLGVILVSFIFMVSGASTINLTIANYTNISGSTYVLNATILGGGATAGTNSTSNVTFAYIPWAGSLTIIGNTSNLTEDQWYFNYTWDTTAVVDGRNYTLNVTAWNVTPAINATNLTANITIDNTAPTIAVYSGAALTAYPNGTSIKTAASLANNLTLNISVTDALFQTNSSNTFCVINVNGEFNHTILYTSNQWCNSSDINITGLSDGNKTLYIYVNDTLNNMRLNTTLVVQIDTTDPTVTAACSPSTVQSGADFPCTCSPSDATSGVNTSATTEASTSGTTTDTVNTGTFTYTCNVADYGGLTASASATYSVTQPPGSSTGGGTTTSTWTTHSITESLFEQGYTEGLEAKNRIKVQVEAEDHFIGVVSITGSQATIEISSDPVQVTLAAGEDAKVDVTEDGFYDIYVLLNGITNNEANVTIQKIHEEVPEGGTGVETTGETGGEEPSAEGGISVWVWILIAAVIVIIIAVSLRKKKKNF